MKHISYLHKKIAAERDSKSLKKIYVDKAKPTAEKAWDHLLPALKKPEDNTLKD